MKLSEMSGVSYVTARHLGHRIGAMMAETNLILPGVVEIDEMDAGVPYRERAKSSRDRHENDPPSASLKRRGTRRPLVLVAAAQGDDVVGGLILTQGTAAITSALDGLDQDGGRPRPECAGCRATAC